MSALIADTNDYTGVDSGCYMRFANPGAGYAHSAIEFNFPSSMGTINKFVHCKALLLNPSADKIVEMEV
jgi:hypothetical protein